MELWMMIAIGAAVAAGIVGAAVLLMRSKRLNSEKQTIRLQQGFGPEYARALGEQGRSAAEADLLKREQVADLIKVRPLSATEVTRYSESWTSTQAQFVTNPGGALSAADHLVGEVIAACGYPAADFEQGANALSVDHPRAVQDYRAAHEVVLRNQKNPVQTDSLRAAMMQYQSVFAELMSTAGSARSVHAA
jgi:hypothetical protein